MFKFKGTGRRGNLFFFLKFLTERFTLLPTGAQRTLNLYIYILYNIWLLSLHKCSGLFHLSKPKLKPKSLLLSKKYLPSKNPNSPLETLKCSSLKFFLVNSRVSPSTSSSLFCTMLAVTFCISIVFRNHTSSW